MQLRQVFYVLLSLLLSIPCVTVAVCAATPTSSFLIEELKQREKDMDGIVVDFSSVNRYVELGSKNPVGYTSTGSFKYGDGNYWRKSKEQNQEGVSDSGSERSYIRNSYVLAAVERKDMPSAFSSLYVKGNNFPSVYERMDVLALFGYIETGHYECTAILDLLKTMSLSVSTESSGDSQNGTVILKGKNDDAEISIWFIQKNHYVPVRILYEYIAPIKDQTKVSRLEYLFDNFQIIEGISCPSKITSTIEHFKVYGVIDDEKGTTQYVPWKEYWQYRSTGQKPPKEIDWSKYPIDGTVSRTTTYSLSNVQLKQQFSLDDFAITADIPEETPIRAINAPYLPYVWRGGKPVPLYDLTVLDRRGQKFLGGPTSLRFWFTMICILIIIAALAHKIYTSFKNRRGITE